MSIKNNSYITAQPSLMYFVREETGTPSPSPTPSPTITPEVQALIDAAVAKEVTGLKNKNTELLGKIKAFDGLDPAKLKEMQERLDQDEDVKLLAEGKKHVVIEKYTERMRTQHQADLAAKDLLVKAQSDRADAYRGSVLDSQILGATRELHKGAVDDALLHARNIFSLDAKGNAVKLDSEGRPELGKDGKTPFSPAEWIELQKELKPHWFPMDTSGAGSQGARDSSGTGKTVKRSSFEQLSPAEQSKMARSGVKIID